MAKWYQTLDMIAFTIIGAFIGGLLVASIQPPTPRLIGHECHGSGGDLWAMEESDFPPCDAIEKSR